MTEEAIRKIEEMITRGELGPGDRLPKETELAARLGVSRSSLREAVRALVQIRVLDVRQGDGTYVTSLEPELLLDGLSFVLDLSRNRTPLQVLEVRRILEPAAAAAAATRRGEEVLPYLRARIEEMSSDITVEKRIDADFRFHRAVVRASGNPVLASLVDGVSARTLQARSWRDIANQQIAAQMRDEHTAIYQAVVDRDPELAWAATVVHIAGVENWVRDALGIGEAADGRFASVAGTLAQRRQTTGRVAAAPVSE